MNKEEAIDAVFQGEVIAHPLLEGKVIYLDEDMMRPVIVSRDSYDFDTDPFQFRHQYIKVTNLKDVIP